MSADVRKTRQAFVDGVMEKMQESGYDPPSSTIEAFRAWVDANNSATASALLDELRAFRAWSRDEDDAAEESRIKWLVGMIDRARIEGLVLIAVPDDDDPRIKAALERYYESRSNK